MKDDKILCPYLRVTKQCFAGCICTANSYGDICGKCRWCTSSNPNRAKMGYHYLNNGCFLKNKRDRLNAQGIKED